jgi:hypothetical protein
MNTEDKFKIIFLRKKKTVKINKSGIKIKTSKNGTRECFLNGELHRENSPAVENIDGGKQWYLNGIEYTEQEYKSELRNVKINKLLK